MSLLSLARRRLILLEILLINNFESINERNLISKGIRHFRKILCGRSPGNDFQRNIFFTIYFKVKRRKCIIIINRSCIKTWYGRMYQRRLHWYPLSSLKITKRRLKNTPWEKPLSGLYETVSTTFRCIWHPGVLDKVLYGVGSALGSSPLPLIYYF